MSVRSVRHTLAALLVWAVLGVHAWPQSSLTAPQAVHTGLTIMSEVVVQSDSLIASRAYEQLPQQSMQFERGLATLGQGLDVESADRRQQLRPLLAKARVASSAMSEAAKTRNDAMLKLTHEQLAAIVKAIVQAFPPELQPSGR